MEKTKMMNLEEAIEHCKKTEAKETLEGNLECALEHKQLSEWLSDYKNVRAKANAYDRLMSGGKKTLKEWANILNNPVAITSDGEFRWFESIPERIGHNWVSGRIDGNFLPNLVDFSGDWKDSLTLPDGWEEACSKN